MKKFLIIASAVAVAAGCAKVTTVDTDGPKEIAFEAYNYAATKAPIIGESLSKSGHKIQVHAIHVNGTSNSEYFTHQGVSFAEDGENNAWYGTTPQYWPAEGTLTFNAISPVVDNLTGANSGSYFKYAGGVVTSINATLADNSTVQADILVAKTVTGQNKTNNGTSGVSMTFHHALAQIVITAKVNEGAPKTQINSITLNNTCQAATLAASTLDNTPSFDWTDPTYTSTGISLSGTGLLDTDLTSTKAEATGVLVVPVTEQSENKYTITVNYDLGSNEGLTYTTNLLSNDSDMISSWEAGKKYVYNLTISATEIKIIPTVTDWTEGTNSSDEITVGA